MKARRLFMMLAASSLLLVAAGAQAQVPPVINYQGQLLDASGNPANGNFTIVFSIFDVATRGMALYTETQNVMVSNGLFNILIGSVTPIPQTLFDDAPRFLEITVNGTVLSPRRRFGSVPYAFNAGGNGSNSPWQISGNDVYYNNGNVGIGTSTPGTPLEITSQLPFISGDTPPNFRITNFGRYVSLKARSSNGTLSAPAATRANDELFIVTTEGHTGSAFSTTGQASILFRATEDWTSTANGTAIRFATTNNGATTESNRMTIDHNGFVGIGTTTPTALLHSQSSGGIPSFLAGGSSADFAVPDNNQAMQFGSWEGSSSTFTEWMRIGSAGNIGIGRSDPT